jgi:hypothetical protein
MVVGVTYERVDDPQDELVHSRAELDALGARFGLTPPEFAEHHEEYQWWLDQVGRHVHGDAADDDARLAAVMTLSRWHSAWVVAQPQFGRAADLTNLGRRLQNLGEFIKDPGCAPASYPWAGGGEIAALDEAIAALAALRSELADPRGSGLVGGPDRVVGA